MTLRKLLIAITVTVATLIAVLTAASFFMLHYALAPQPGRANVDSCYSALYERYPDLRPWVDSLHRAKALRDTFVIMPTGERHHALYVPNGSHRTALVLHGWRNESIHFLFLARLYDRMGFNVVVPDLHAHGLSDGDAIGMGWPDRLDVLHWMNVFRTDSMVLHGVSMGAATAMMVSGEPMPVGVKDVRFVADCGYTSAWDEFAEQLRQQFGLPAFPLLHCTSQLCRVRYGWDFREASALEQVKRCRWPMLLIHGDSDLFVPTAMVHRLYAAKPQPKRLWIVPGTDHARSYLNHPDEYTTRLSDFLPTRVL